MESLVIKRALISVTNKDGLLPFATFLAENGVELVSTGGTCKAMQDAGLTVTQVDSVTGFPEILGGRVKTLHPKIHGGILADKDNPAHMETLREQGIQPFDMVCVNLYNFADAVKKGLDFKQAIEDIDIGGPCMLRAAAKNYHSMAVVPGIEWYAPLMEEMKNNGMALSLATRQKLSQHTFTLTSEYDGMIAAYLAK